MSDVARDAVSERDAQRAAARAQFIRMMKWIVVIAVAMVAGALAYLAATGDLSLHMVVATVGGVFFSVLLGCGLFAASFFSANSGYDQSISDSTRGARDDVRRKGRAGDGT